MSTAASRVRFDRRPVVVVMGVSGCGKSTVGAALADRQSLPFLDGDDFHPESNVDKMSRGIALTDEDRRPWLQALGAAMRENADATGGVVATCSALKRDYRTTLAHAIGLPTVFVLLEGSRDVLFARMSARQHHYMPPRLLDSQLATLELPDADEPVLTISIENEVDDVVGEAVAMLTTLTSAPEAHRD